MPRRRLHRPDSDDDIPGSAPKHGSRTQPKDVDRLLGTHVKAKTAKNHHIDKRAHLVAAEPGGDDELLTTNELAMWFRVSTQWLEIGRHKGYGPKFQKISTRCIRYRRGDVLQWLKTRTHAITSDYSERKRA